MISFVRGDTLAFKTKLKTQDKIAIRKEDIDTLFVTSRKSASTESPIIFQKTLQDVEIDSDGYCHVKFDPINTEDLKYATYFFDIEITLKSGYRKTRLFQFKLTKETTIHGKGDESGS